MATTAQEKTNAYRLWSDAESEIDLLGFTHLVDAVEGLVVSDGLLPATIGVFGDWGSGKTSVLTMTSKRLETDSNTCTLWFNGWLFEGYDQAKASLMERIVNELIRKRTTSDRIKKIAIRLFRRIDWFRVVGSALKGLGAFTIGGPPAAAVVAAPDFAELAKKAGESVAKLDNSKLDEILNASQERAFNQNVVGFRNDLIELLNEAKIERLVVFIDDLDRCLPSTIIETLEAIKLFLSVGNVAFVIGADERLVKYAVQNRFPGIIGEHMDIGRDYLEKLIQYPVRIPSLSPSEVQSYISLLILDAEGDFEKTKKVLDWFNTSDRLQSGSVFSLEVLTELGITTSDKLEEGLILSAQIGPLLGMGLNGNPRQCKRFLNMLMMRLGMAESRGVKLSRRLLAKLMILEYLKPNLFRELARMQSKDKKQQAQIIALQKIIKEKESQQKTKNTKKEQEENSDDSFVSIWLKDPVVYEWLNMEPKFDEETDLELYFYFSRDKMTGYSQQVQRMSSAAREIYSNLLSRSEAKQKSALGELSSLSEADAMSLFEELCGKARGEEGSGTLKLLLKICSSRNDLITGFITFLSTLPDRQIPLSFPPSLLTIVKGTEYQNSLEEILSRWETSSIPRLVQSAQNVLNRIKEDQK